MKKLIDDEPAQVPDWLKRAIESLSESSSSTPNCPPFRPWTPWEAAWIRSAIKGGLLQAEDYPELVQEECEGQWHSTTSGI